MNLVVMALYKIKGQEQKYEYLQEMLKYSQKSYENYIQEMDQFRIIGNGKQVNTVLEMFKDVFYKQLDIWKSGHNILFVDVDSLCLKPTEVFNKFDNMRLFARVDKQNWKDMDLPIYFLSGVRYIPGNLDKKIWEIGENMWRNIPKKWHMRYHWDYEQYIYNKMFYGQPEVKENPYSFLDGNYHTTYINGKPPDVNILTFNASKDPKHILNLMGEVYDRSQP